MVDLSTSNPAVTRLVTHYIAIGLDPGVARHAAVNDVYAAYCNNYKLDDGSEISEDAQKIIRQSQAEKEEEERQINAILNKSKVTKPEPILCSEIVVEKGGSQSITIDPK